jgi:hypothetical protein
MVAVVLRVGVKDWVQREVDNSEEANLVEVAWVEVRDWAEVLAAAAAVAAGWGLPLMDLVVVESVLAEDLEQREAASFASSLASPAS